MKAKTIKNMKEEEERDLTKNEELERMDEELDEPEETGPEEGDNDLLNNLVEKALNGKEDEDEDLIIPAFPNPATARSQQMIQLIQAIDRKIPLDDYAEQNQMGFDEVLEKLEHLIKRGTKIDIQYFIDEVLEQDCQEELFDYFDKVNGDVDKAIIEFDGLYQPEEVRLARLVWNQ